MHTGLSGIGCDPISHPFLLPRALEESRSNSKRQEHKTARLHHNWPLNKLDHRADWQPKAAGFSRKEKPTTTSSKLLKQSLYLIDTHKIHISNWVLPPELLIVSWVSASTCTSPRPSVQHSTMGLREPNHPPPQYRVPLSRIQIKASRLASSLPWPPVCTYPFCFWFEVPFTIVCSSSFSMPYTES